VVDYTVRGTELNMLLPQAQHFG